jgi:hypothetical protein
MLDWKLATGTGVQGSKINTTGKKSFIKKSGRDPRTKGTESLAGPLLFCQIPNQKRRFSKDFGSQWLIFAEHSNIHQFMLLKEQHGS